MVPMTRSRETSASVLKLLRQTDSRLSGEAIAQELGVSRTAVWKAVGVLRDQGYLIDAVSKRGYRLQKETDRLSAPGIASGLSAFWADLPVSVFDRVTSTNSLAKQALVEGESLLYAAATQTAGRGRRGRTFHSPAGTGLYFSVAFPWEREETPVLLTTMAAVTTALSLERAFGVKLGIKWVNDLFFEGRKVSGILTEAISDLETGRAGSVVVGIGINLSTPRQAFPEELRMTAGSLTDGKGFINRNLLIADITNGLGDLIESLPDRSYLDEYRKRCFILGRKVRLDTGQEILPEAISDQGALLYREDGQLLEVRSGEISITGLSHECP